MLTPNLLEELWRLILEDFSIVDILKLTLLNHAMNQAFKQDKYWAHLLWQDYFDAFQAWEKNGKNTSALTAYALVHEEKHLKIKANEIWHYRGWIDEQVMISMYRGDIAHLKTMKLTQEKESFFIQLLLKICDNGFSMLQKINNFDAEVKDYLLKRIEEFICSRADNYYDLIKAAIIFNKDYKYITKLWISKEKFLKLNSQCEWDINYLDFAAAFNNLNMVEYFLDCDFDVNSFKKGKYARDFYSPLHAACYGGSSSMVTFLLEKGAEINKSSNKNQTPLYMACKQGNSEVVEILLANNAILDAERLSGSLFSEQSSEIFIAVAHGHIACLELLFAHLKKNKTDFKSLTQQLNQLLFVAVKKGYPATTQFLCQQGAEVNGSQEGEFPLSVAISLGHTQVVTTLLSQGASINNLIPSFIEDCVATACEKGQYTLVKLLLKLFPLINHSTHQKGPSAYVAASKGQLPIVHFLFQIGVDLDAPFDGETPLYIALKKKHSQVAHFLIEHHANATIGKNNTLPIHLACLNSDMESITLLLKKHPEMLEKRNGLNQTPLLIAAQNKNLTLVEFLINAGADVNAQDNTNYTTLHFMASIGNIPLIERLIAEKANPFLETTTKQTAAGLAQEHHKARMLLVEYKREWRRNLPHPRFFAKSSKEAMGSVNASPEKGMGLT